MEKRKLIRGIAVGVGVLAFAVALWQVVTLYNRPKNPAVDRLSTINDSLYKVIERNNAISNTLYGKLDSITIKSDTIIERQEITNKYYRNETYNILNSNGNAATKQFQSTIQKSDSLLKSGFYTKTLDLRYAVDKP